MLKPCYTFTNTDIRTLFNGTSSSFQEAKFKLLIATGIDLDSFGKVISSYCLYRLFENYSLVDKLFGNDANYNVLTGMLFESDLMDQALSERYDHDWKTRKYETMRDFEDSFLIFRMMRRTLDDMSVRISPMLLNNYRIKKINRYGWFLDAAERKIFMQPDDE